MEMTKLGNSGIAVTRLCLGTWNMGGESGWGPESEDAAVDLIRHALDSGCNFVDTARGYGRGQAERVVGRAVRGRRDQVVIATKMLQCRREEVVRNLEASLACLGTDYIDLYICHWPVPSLPLEPFFAELAAQRERGRIRAIGVSNFDAAQLEAVLRYGVVSLQPPFSILWRGPEGLLAFCREHHLAVTPYSPLAQGLLTGRYSRQQHAARGGPREHNLLYTGEAFAHSLEAARQVDAVADQLGVTSSQVALAWARQTPGVTSLTVGASRPSQWEENIASLQVTLSPEDYARLDAAGLQVWSRFRPDDTMWGWKPT